MTTASARTSAPGTTGASTGSPGLTTTDVLLRLERDGANVLPEPVRENPWAMFARQLSHLLALLLWVGAGLALLAGMPELSAAIVVIVLLNALFAFVQEYRADRSTQELKALLPATARVVRNGTESDVPVQDLVVDDVVRLTAGARIAADMLLVEAGRFAVDESMVTGESGAVPREIGPAGPGRHVRDVGRGPCCGVGNRTEDDHRLDRLDDRARRASHKPVDPAAERGGADHRRHRGLDRRAARHRGAAAWPAGSGGVPVRRGCLRRAGTRRAAAYRDTVVGARRPADGQAARPRASPRRRRDPRGHYLHLHRQDRHPHPEQDERGRDRDAGRVGHGARARLRPGRDLRRQSGGPGPDPPRRVDRAGLRLRTCRAAPRRLDGRR